MRFHRGRSILWIVAVTCLLSGSGAAAQDSERVQRYHWLVQRAADSAKLDETSGLVVNQAGHPDVCAESPGYVLAILESTKANEAENLSSQVLEAILSAQDTADGSKTQGRFPWQLGAGSGPSVRATYFASPVLSQIYTKHQDKLSDQLQQKLRASLELALDVVKRNSGSAENEVTQLLGAAALAMLDRAVGDGTQVNRSTEYVTEWLTDVLSAGLRLGHSPSSDSFRLAALKWIWQAANPEQRTGALDKALALLYQDFAFRVQPGSGALAGAALYAQRNDYLHGGEYSPYIIYSDLAGPRPTRVMPFAIFFVAQDYQPVAQLLSTATDLLPYQISTVARQQAYITRTDTYLHRLFSLGTMTGQPSATSIPLLLTFAKADSRPTAYFFTTPQASHVSSMQFDSTALITADFDFIGQGNRRTAMLQGILGPRTQIDRVLLGTQQWNGQPAAVPETGTIAFERSACYVGVRLLRAGPVEGKNIVSGPKPGILEWTGQGESAELQLTVYGRKHGYGLQRLLHNLRVGVVVKAALADRYSSLSAFAAELADARVQQGTERVKELLPEPTDPFKAVLTEHKPKSKSELEYKHMLLHTISYHSEQVVGELQEDMLSEQVMYRKLNGELVVPVGPWQVGQRVLQWGDNNIGSFLTVSP